MSVSIILCLLTITCVTSEMQVHHVFVSRNSRSKSAPIETGYMYNQVDNHPGILSLLSAVRTTSEPVLENYNPLKRFNSPMQYHPIDLTKQSVKPFESMLAKRDLEYVAEKAESKYNAKFLPSKAESDLKYDKLKSSMHYQPDGLNEVISRYDASEFNADDDDVRTSSRGVYDNWPSYHPSPYDYEHNKFNFEKAKAKDKRYSMDSSRVIPIHEDLSHDVPEPYKPVLSSIRDTASDNPMMGHDPFFSFVLNDYFDKDNEYDQLSFKGVHWGKEFDVDDFYRRNRRLENNYHSPDDHATTSSNLHFDHNEIEADSVTEKGYDKSNDFTKHKYKKNIDDETKHEKNEHKHTEFKDFIDSFANKFGSEDHKKDAKYVLKRNQDNGENRKGFHRVYHKDEYMEDKEFYNNNNNSVRAAEKGSAKAHIGGSEGQLQSHAAAALGNRSSLFSKHGNTNKNRFVNNQTGHDNTKGYDVDGHFNRYRDVAKQTAQSNNADYSDNVDHYRI